MNKILANILFFVLLIKIWSVSSSLFAQTSETVFKVNSPVSDKAELLSETERSQLEQKLLAFEKEHGAQIVVVTVPTTGELSIEQFAVELFALNKFGRQGIDDGVLLLIARDDRRMRIEVGYGLEASLTDALSAKIIQNILQPHFRAGRFYEGIREAVEAIMTIIQGNELAEKLNNSDIPLESDFSLIEKIFLFFFWLIFSLIISNILFSFRWHWLIRLLLIGGMYLFLWKATQSWFVALIIMLVLYFITRFNLGGTSYISSSSSSSSFSSYSSFPGSSWSGGGGSSGGGGASGSW